MVKDFGGIYFRYWDLILWSHLLVHNLFDLRVGISFKEVEKSVLGASLWIISRLITLIVDMNGLFKVFQAD